MKKYYLKSRNILIFALAIIIVLFSSFSAYAYSYKCNNLPLNSGIVYDCNNLPLNAGGAVCSPYSGRLCNICSKDYSYCPHTSGVTYGGTVCSPYSGSICNVCGGNYATCPHVSGTRYGGTVCSPVNGICNICHTSYATCPHYAGVTYGGTVCSPYSGSICNICRGNYATCPHVSGRTYGGTVCTPYSATICNICRTSYAACPHVSGTTYGSTYHVHTSSCPYHYTTHTHTDACYFYGCKQYVSNNSTSVNCQGYSFFTNSWPSGWFTLDDYNYCIDSNTTTEMMLSRTKTRMVTWLNSNFSGKWQEVSSESADLSTNQWIVCMRVGKKVIDGDMTYDYHYWYRTNTGVWANKHGGTPSVLLPSSDTPSTNSSSGWELYEYSPFYDSATIYYKVTE